ncbi:MAG: riboflavin synthase [Chitinophagaceae bacterium]
MFTGIIETTGRIHSVLTEGSNRLFWVESSLSGELKIDQSLSHQGVCLTIDALSPGMHQVTAIAETLEKTTLGSWKTGDLVNLERCLPANGRFDGHFVQGHVDARGECIGRMDRNGSWEFRFRFPVENAPLIIEKGSIAINGVSLTCFNVGRSEFTVAIIPYTFEHTQFSQIQPGDSVNLEFDLLGKYINRRYQLSS